MISRPLFSVLIANYNNGNFLDEAIASILSQTYDNWEIIIVDDCSTDNSASIYQKYSYNSKIKVFKNSRNKGVGYAKNKCARMANGEICGFLDSDDTLGPDAVERMVNLHLQNQHNSIIYSTHYICNENLVPHGIAHYVGQIPQGAKSYTIHLPTVSHFATFKTNCFKRTNGISPLFLKAADKDLYFKLEDTGPVRFINDPLYNYRNHINSISLNENVDSAYRYEKAAKAMAILRSGQTTKLLKIIPETCESLVKSMFYVSSKGFRKGYYLHAVSLFIKAFFLAPKSAAKLTISKMKIILFR